MVYQYAGLWSQHLAATIENLPASSIPSNSCARASILIIGQKPALIYPLPDPELAGLAFTAPKI